MATSLTADFSRLTLCPGAGGQSGAYSAPSQAIGLLFIPAAISALLALSADGTR
jgi:hypothetical protein